MSALTSTYCIHETVPVSHLLLSTFDDLVQLPQRPAARPETYQLIQGIEREDLLKSSFRVSPFYPLPWVTVLRWIVQTKQLPPNSPGLIPTFHLNKPPSRRPHVVVGPQAPQSMVLRVRSGVCVASPNLPSRKPKVKKTAASPSTTAQKQRCRYQGTGVGSVS